MLDGVGERSASSRPGGESGPAMAGSMKASSIGTPSAIASSSVERNAPTISPAVSASSWPARKPVTASVRSVASAASRSSPPQRSAVRLMSAAVDARVGVPVAGEDRAEEIRSAVVAADRVRLPAQVDRSDHRRTTGQDPPGVDPRLFGRVCGDARETAPNLRRGRRIVRRLVRPSGATTSMNVSSSPKPPSLSNHRGTEVSCRQAHGRTPIAVGGLQDLLESFRPVGVERPRLRLETGPVERDPNVGDASVLQRGQVVGPPCAEAVARGRAEVGGVGMAERGGGRERGAPAEGHRW